MRHELDQPACFFTQANFYVSLAVNSKGQLVVLINYKEIDLQKKNVKKLINLSGHVEPSIFIIDRYIYIEWPFWYGIKVTTKRLIIYNILGGVTSHLIGMVPLMSNFAAKQKCSGSDILLLGTGYSISYAVIILLLFSAVGK